MITAATDDQVQLDVKKLNRIEIRTRESAMEPAGIELIDEVIPA